MDEVGPDFSVDRCPFGGPDGRGPKDVRRPHFLHEEEEVGQDLVWEEALHNGPVVGQNLLHNAFKTLLNRVHRN
jgi:hypothetical protein